MKCFLCLLVLLPLVLCAPYEDVEDAAVRGLIPRIHWDKVIQAILAKLNGVFTEAGCTTACHNVVHTLVPGFAGAIAEKGCEVTRICHKVKQYLDAHSHAGR